jgi:ferricrocin synthase
LSTLLNSTSISHVVDTSKLDSLLAEFTGRFSEPICVETGISAGGIVGVYPCTPVQEGMLSQFIRSKGNLYFNHVIFKLPAITDSQHLRSSWEAVFESLDILRTGFASIDDPQHQFAMVVHKKGSINLPWSVVEAIDERDEVIAKRKRETASLALERLHLPPWNVTLFQLPSEQNLLMFSSHHALYDAQSFRLILNDVVLNYSGENTILESQFAGILGMMLRHTMDTKTVEEDRAFWKKQLEGSTISRFPNLCPLRVRSTASHVSSIKASWSLSNIEKACRQLGVSVHAVGQAAWARVLSAYMGEKAVTMGVGMYNNQEAIY